MIAECERVVDTFLLPLFGEEKREGPRDVSLSLFIYREVGVVAVMARG